jgi:hypothetical protein
LTSIKTSKNVCALTTLALQLQPNVQFIYVDVFLMLGHQTWSKKIGHLSVAAERSSIIFWLWNYKDDRDLSFNQLSWRVSNDIVVVKLLCFSIKEFKTTHDEFTTCMQNLGDHSLTFWRTFFNLVRTLQTCLMSWCKLSCSSNCSQC